MKRSFGRTPRYNKPLTERVNVLFTVDQVPQLAELAAQSGAKDVSTWLREIALGERMHPNTPQPATVSENAIAFDLAPDDMRALEKLADDVLHIDDVNLFMKSLARAALSAGPQNVHKLIYSRLDRARETQIAADKKAVASASLRSEKTARIRKAA